VFDEGVSGLEIGKRGEVAVGGVEHLDAVGEAEGGDAGIVDFRAGELGPAGQAGELPEVGFAFGEEQEGFALEPVLKKGQGGINGSARAVNAGVGGDAEEFVEAGPGNRPGTKRITESFERVECHGVKSRVLPVGIDEDIGVQCDHAVSDLLAVAEGAQLVPRNRGCLGCEALAGHDPDVSRNRFGMHKSGLVSEPKTKGFMHGGTHRDAVAGGLLFESRRQIVSNVDRGFHKNTVYRIVK